MHHSVDQLAQDCRNDSLASFRLRYGSAFLVYFGPGGTWAEQSDRFLVCNHNPPRNNSGPLTQTHQKALVFPVRRGGGASADNAIALGRSRKSDVLIHDDTVSRVHAHFVDVTQHGMRVRDAGSQNGTFVDGVRLVPNGKPTKVSLWTCLRFGSFETVFYTAGHLFRVVQRI